MNPYLIQRGKFVDREYKTGIDSILQWDYMGSAEFEWGALPKSLKIIRDIKESCELFDVEYKGKMFTVYCHKDHKGEIPTYFEKVETQHLKEFSGFDKVFVNPFNFSVPDFWWDIENHVMWWQKNPEFEEKFKNQI